VTPPTRRTVVLDTVGQFASYGPGLAAVTFLDDSLPRPAALVVGVLVFGVATSLAHYALFQKVPKLEIGLRPYRYSLPNGIGLFSATAVYWLGLDAATTFALAIPLLIAGQTLSQLHWAAATTPASAGASA
jgi:hypothetical protein